MMWMASCLNARMLNQLAAQVLDVAGRAVRPGITTEEIDVRSLPVGHRQRLLVTAPRAVSSQIIVHDATVARNAYPSPLNYRGFPKSCCTSVNEVVCHGIPDARALVDGDILNIDISVYYEGMHADLNETFCVGAFPRFRQLIAHLQFDHSLLQQAQKSRLATSC